MSNTSDRAGNASQNFRNDSIRPVGPRRFQSVPASGVPAHIRTESPSDEVVAKQKAPGNELQSESAAQPGAHWLPAVAVATHAFWRPSEFPPPAPSPTQSVDRTHDSVHHSPLHDSPALHGRPEGLQGSPTPSSLQTGHLVSRQDVSESRSATPPGDCVAQLLRQAETPAQVCSQFRRFSQSVLAVHAAKAVQQLASAHWVH
jgi:hypothetical protein